MATSHRESATILEFQPRSGGLADRARKPGRAALLNRMPEPPPVVDCGSWYHAAAIQEDRGRKS